VTPQKKASMSHSPAPTPRCHSKHVHTEAVDGSSSSSSSIGGGNVGASGGGSGGGSGSGSSSGGVSGGGSGVTGNGLLVQPLNDAVEKTSLFRLQCECGCLATWPEKDSRVGAPLVGGATTPLSPRAMFSRKSFTATADRCYTDESDPRRAVHSLAMRIQAVLQTLAERTSTVFGLSDVELVHELSR
jgi:hypothetical protein